MAELTMNPAPDYRQPIRELRTPATIAALNAACEDHEIDPSRILAIIPEPYRGHLGHDGPQFRVIYRI